MKSIKKWSFTQVMVFGFLALILVGACILMLPICNANGKWLNFPDALFTSCTCVCVTGLVTVVPAFQFTFLGKLVMLFLIQVGGWGVIVCASCKLSLGVLVGLPVGGFQALDAVYLFLGKQDTPSYPLSFDVSQLLVPPDGRYAHTPFLRQLPDGVILRRVLWCPFLPVFLKRTPHACADKLLKLVARYQYHFCLICHNSLILSSWRQR